MAVKNISPKDWCDKGEKLLQLGNLDVAMQYFDKALEIDPRLARAWNDKAGVLGFLGRHEESIKCCDEALKLNPKFSEAWHNKGSNIAFLGRFKEAIECYDKALEINPKYAEAWFNKGLTIEEEAKRLEDLVEIKHSSPINKYIEYENAIECYEKALNIDPMHERARKSREYLLDKLGRNISMEKSNSSKDRFMERMIGSIGKKCPKCGSDRLTSVVGGNMSLYKCSKCGKEWTERGWR
jgi:tetratricopeptide (TPR) repeat protein